HETTLPALGVVVSPRDLALRADRGDRRVCLRVADVDCRIDLITADEAMVDQHAACAMRFSTVAASATGGSKLRQLHLPACVTAAVPRSSGQRQSAHRHPLWEWPFRSGP